MISRFLAFIVFVYTVFLFYVEFFGSRFEVFFTFFLPSGHLFSFPLL